MKIIIGAGGTGGHLYPALAFVEYIQSKRDDVEILFVGTTNRIESKVVPSKGYPYIGLHVKGLSGNPIQKAIAGAIFLKSVLQARKIIKQFKPDIVIGFGGYPSASICKAAQQMKVKTMIHEQNSIVGLTNRILLEKVNGVVCCYQKAYRNLPTGKTYLFGNPRATAIANQEINDEVYTNYGLTKERPFVVVVMGSLGSKTVNQVIVDALDDFKGKAYDVLFVTGKNDYQNIMQSTKAPSNVKIVEYLDDMLSVMAKASIVVTRAGASTLAEVVAMKVPSIIIPSPYVTANHQEYNARELVEKNAATMILEKDLTVANLLENIDELLNDTTKIEVIKDNMHALATPNACDDMYQFMLQILGEK